MDLKASLQQSLPHTQKKNPILTLAELQQVAKSDSPFIQVEISRQQIQPVFLDTSLQQILFGEPIGDETPSSNLSTVWIITEPCNPTSANQYIISNVTTPIGQAQPTDPIGDKTYGINVLPVSTNQEFVWTADVSDGKWALYIEQSGVRLYALPNKSDNSCLTPPRDTLLQAVHVTGNRDVYRLAFNWVESIKYFPDIPDGIDVYLRRPPPCTN